MTVTERANLSNDTTNASPVFPDANFSVKELQLSGALHTHDHPLWRSRKHALVSCASIPLTCNASLTQ